MGNTSSKSAASPTLVSEPSSKQKIQKPIVTITQVEPVEKIPEKAKIFSVQGKNLKLDTAKDVKEIIEEMNKCDLYDLNFSGNTIGVEASEHLSKALEMHKSIKDIDISDCFTGRLKEEVPAALKFFSDSIKSLPNLSIINLSDNAFGPMGAKAISNLLSNSITLEHLILNNNGLGPEGGNVIAESLLLLQENNNSSNPEPKESKSNLRKVMIGRNRLENGSIVNIATALKLHGLLEEIYLYQNGIRPEGIVALCRALSSCSNLQVLDLQDNTFSKEGALALAESLPSWPELRVLNVGDCLLGAKGAKVVLETIFKNDNCKLQTLNLQFNEIDEFGAALIAANLKNLRYLKSLNLNGNAFNPNGIAATSIRSVANSQVILDQWDEMEYTEESEIEESEQITEEESAKEEEREIANVEEISEEEMEREKVFPESAAPIKTEEIDKLILGVENIEISSSHEQYDKGEEKSDKEEREEEEVESQYSVSTENTYSALEELGDIENVKEVSVNDESLDHEDNEDDVRECSAIKDNEAIIPREHPEQEHNSEELDEVLLSYASHRRDRT